VKDILTELEVYDTEFEVSKHEVLNARKQQKLQSSVPPTADPRKYSPSEEHLDSPVNLEDELRKVVAKIKELRVVQHEGKSFLAANLQSILDRLDSICDIKTDRNLPLSDYLQIGAHERAVCDVLKDVNDFQSGWDSSVNRLVELADLVASKLHIVGEKGKDDVAPKPVIGRYNGSRKHLVSKNTNAISKAQSKGLRKQTVSENKTPQVSQGKSEGHRKQPVSENKTPEISQGTSKGPRKQSVSETKTPEVSQGQSEGPRKQPVSKTKTPEISQGTSEGPRKQSVSENKILEVSEGQSEGSRKQSVSETKTPEISQGQSEGRRKQPVSETKTPEVSQGQSAGPRKQSVSENKTPAKSECQIKGPQKQAENEITAISQSQMKRPSTRNKSVFRDSGDGADAGKPKANSAPVAKLVEELHSLCQLVLLTCDNTIATQPTVSTSFIMCANDCAFHARQCLHLALTSFLCVVFSSQLLSAMANLIDSLTASNVNETEAKELISAVRQLTVTVPVLQSKFQHLYSDYLVKVTCPTTPENAETWVRYKDTGTDWRTKAICKHLDTAEKVLEEAKVKLNEALSDYDKEFSSSDSDFEQVDVTEGFLAIAKTITSIGDSVSSLTETMKV
jgi:hypothetical protein